MYRRCRLLHRDSPLEGRCLRGCKSVSVLRRSRCGAPAPAPGAQRSLAPNRCAPPPSAARLPIPAARLAAPPRRLRVAPQGSPIPVAPRKRVGRSLVACNADGRSPGRSPSRRASAVNLRPSRHRRPLRAITRPSHCRSALHPCRARKNEYLSAVLPITDLTANFRSAASCDVARSSASARPTRRRSSPLVAICRRSGFSTCEIPHTIAPHCTSAPGAARLLGGFVSEANSARTAHRIVGAGPSRNSASIQLRMKRIPRCALASMRATWR